MKLVLHNYWRSSASHRVRIALGLKGLAYQYVPVNILEAEQQGDAYKAKNPHSQVPTLEITEDDGTVYNISQSMAILEYLDERFFEPPLLPRLLVKSEKVGDRVLFRRARARALAEIINSGIQPLQNMSTVKAVKKLGGNDGEWVRPWIAIGLNSYAKLAADTAGVYSVGDLPTIADCCLIPQLASARRFGVDYSHHELLVRIEKMCLSLPAFAAAAPEAQPDAVKS
jgi:maleylpyruvate isomerase